MDAASHNFEPVEYVSSVQPHLTAHPALLVPFVDHKRAECRLGLKVEANLETNLDSKHLEYGEAVSKYTT